VPYLGSIKHLDWLADLEVPENVDVGTFLEETAAVTSIARFIHRHRNFWRTQHRQIFTLDTRPMEMGPDWTGIFHGAVDVYKEVPKEVNEDVQSHQTLGIYGQPQPNDLQGFDYEYRLTAPIKGSTYRYDPSRRIVSSVTRSHVIDFKKYDLAEYNEVASPGSGRADPEVLIWIIQHAARDILKIIHHVNGSDKNLPKLEPSPPDQVHFNPRGLEDDRDEFKKKFSKQPAQTVVK
jgi:hypothetical protein